MATPTRPDAILTDETETRTRLHENGCRVPADVGLVALSILDGNADAGIDQHPEEIGRVAVLLVISLINDHSLGVPPIFRQSLIEGSWVDGSTLPDRSAGRTRGAVHQSVREISRLADACERLDGESLA